MVTGETLEAGGMFHRPGKGLAVLVEEEDLVRRLWTEYFSGQGVRLQVYDSAEAFLGLFRLPSGPVEFFFDQDFGKRRGVGLHLAVAVRNWPGRVRTSLVTSYSPENFESELMSGIIDAVLPKFPEEIFGSKYLERYFSRRAVVAAQ